MTSGYRHCTFTQTWDDIVGSPDVKTRYRSGGLGKRIVPGKYRVWLFDANDPCHGGMSGEDMMCYVFNERFGTFLSMGPNSKVKFV